MTGQRVTYRTRAIAGEDDVLAEFHRRTGQRGGAKSLAYDCNVSEAMISRIRSGGAPITPRIAVGLGFRLRYERSDNGQ
ncbi:MAG TPA: hypothetical protein VGW34_09525 [Allosphingosinicella sp.]|nr:hypothetical protein [Allosphingosinicella sp.]